MSSRETVVLRTGDLVSKCDVAEHARSTNLVDHQALESVCHGIEVVDPPEPRMHVADWHSEASVNDQGKNKDRRRSHGLCETPGKSSNRSEHHRHSQSAGEGEEIESKERSRSSSEICHEV